MNPLLSTLQKMIGFFEGQKISYMLIGGIANIFYGNPRQTFDIDIKFDLADLKLDDFITQLSAIGSVAVEEPLKFFAETSVLPLDVDNVRIDLISARVCTAEDLIIQKAISVRDKDWIDIAAIIGPYQDAYCTLKRLNPYAKKIGGEG